MKVQMKGQSCPRALSLVRSPSNSMVNRINVALLYAGNIVNFGYVEQGRVELVRQCVDTGKRPPVLVILRRLGCADSIAPGVQMMLYLRPGARERRDAPVAA
jgi:hypothetical protein